MMNENSEQNAMDYGDEIAYEAGTLYDRLPQGQLRTVCWVGRYLFGLGDVVKTKSGYVGEIQRIVWHKRVKNDCQDHSYYQIDIETEDHQYINDVATNCKPHTNGIVLWDIPC